MGVPKLNPVHFFVGGGHIYRLYTCNYEISKKWTSHVKGAQNAVLISHREICTNIYIGNIFTDYKNSSCFVSLPDYWLMRIILRNGNKYKWKIGAWHVIKVFKPALDQPILSKPKCLRTSVTVRIISPHPKFVDRMNNNSST